MNSNDKPRPAFPMDQPPRAPEVASSQPVSAAGARAPTDQETILLSGLRLMQRVSAGGTVTVLERAALEATAQMLRKLADHCDEVLESLSAERKPEKKSSSRSPRSKKKGTSKNSKTARKEDDGLQ